MPGESTGGTEEVLVGGSLNAGRVVRIGDTVRRPRSTGSDLHEAVLLHLERVGFDAAPRFLGIDERGRQVLSFVEGVVDAAPPWQLDDEANARALGDLAALARRAQDALVGFTPPAGAEPMFEIPGPGPAWSHADVGYHNAVYRDDAVVALIDWEAVAQGDELYDPASLVAMCARGPRADRPDELDDRIVATRRAVARVSRGFGMTGAQLERFPAAISSMLAHAADVWTRIERPSPAVDAMRWKAAWFAEHGDLVR